jgi:peptidoglycan/LPS O-acetylase OafA/YrhL
MESPWTLGLIAIALVTMGLSYRIPRAWRWIGLGGIDFFATTLFADFGPTPDIHPFFTAGCDGLVCYIILRNYREHWELGVAMAFLVSLFCSCVMLGFQPYVKDWVYASLLELCNLAAMICIAATGVAEMIGQNASSPFRSVRDSLRHARHTV